ncbi:protein kinase domain-containing protein [Actinomadura sp. 3N407]|uniref:protein kinase domain-containing protein n=1 Tax=Actinomadura sp. 3N407 TaxID=3457423 RepID=UPI003FCE2FC4
MQYVEGITVDYVLDAEETLSISWAALIAAQVCAVLNVAHRRPLVHRDLKPTNLMVCPDGCVCRANFATAASTPLRTFGSSLAYCGMNEFATAS